MPRRNFNASRETFLQSKSLTSDTLPAEAEQASPHQVISKCHSSEDLISQLIDLVSQRKTRATSSLAKQQSINQQLITLSDFLKYHYEASTEQEIQEDILPHLKDMPAALNQEVMSVLKPMLEHITQTAKRFRDDKNCLESYLSETKEEEAIANYKQAHDAFYILSILFYFATYNHHQCDPDKRIMKVSVHTIPNYQTAQQDLAKAMQRLQDLDASTYHLFLLSRQIHEDYEKGELRHDLMRKAAEVRLHHVNHPRQTKLLPEKLHRQDIAVIAERYLREPDNTSYRLSEDQHTEAFNQRTLAPLLFNLIANPALATLEVPLQVTRMCDLEYLCEILKLNTSLLKLDIHIDPSIGDSGLLKLIDVFEHNTTLRSLPEKDLDLRLQALLERNKVIAAVHNSYAQLQASRQARHESEIEAMLQKIDRLYWQYADHFKKRDPHLSRLQFALISNLMFLNFEQATKEKPVRLEQIQKAFHFMMDVQVHCDQAKFTVKMDAFFRLVSREEPEQLYYLLLTIPKENPLFSIAQNHMAHLLLNPEESEQPNSAMEKARLMQIVAHFDAAGEETLRDMHLDRLSRIKSETRDLQESQTEKPVLADTTKANLDNLNTARRTRTVYQEVEKPSLAFTWSTRPVQQRIWAVFFFRSPQRQEATPTPAKAPSLLASLS